VGLDAFVRCRCWQDGFATPPGDPELVGVDEDGWLGLLVPYEGNEAAHREFDEWLHGGCSHERMRYVDERVSNWGGYRMFQDALRHAGPSHFPTLFAELPESNGGQMSAEAAGRALGELDFFIHQAALGDDVVLVDEATGAVVMEYIAAYDGVMMLGPGYRAGVDPEGFFVLDPNTDPPLTLFRSTRFGQRVVDEDRVEFADRALAERPPVLVAMPPVRGWDHQPEPSELRVEVRPRTAWAFGYILEPLNRLCQAAVTTGNPVVWT
jgi:hypothetical protein